MENLSISEVVGAVNGVLLNCSENFEINGISTDSRKINKGDLFVALVGAHFDGHDFVEKAIEGGASAVVVSHEVDCKCPQVLVEDTLTALKNIAKYYRKKFHIPVVGVTGSTGKTSTKEMIASVLKQKYNVHKTQKNFNNEIGLPLTVFELNKDHEISVLEMGMNNFGEIQRLADIARPTIAVITNIGTAHIENLGSREGILKAKMEITTYFDENCTLIVNGDDEYLSTIGNKHYKIIKTSIKDNGDYNAKDIVNLGEEGVQFKCMYRGEEHIFNINVPGIHNVYNALAAIAIGDIFNMNVDQLKNGIYKFTPGNLRMNIINIDNNIKIIEDCYNANLESMKAAIDVLESFNQGRRIAVLGDMFELGDFSEEAHRQVGQYLIGKCDMVITVGDQSKYIFDECNSHFEAKHFITKEEACLYLKNEIVTNDVILIKASRGMKMEYITACLIKDRKRGN
jgi:UDP-N-acetylmuramoyl-tripeptide--D-alanyl-D-alanine ligase